MIHILLRMGRPPQLVAASFYKPSVKPPVFLHPDSDQVFKELDSNVPDGIDLDLWKRLCAIRLKLFYIVLKSTCHFLILKIFR